MLKLMLIVVLLSITLIGLCDDSPEDWFETQYTDALNYCYKNRTHIEINFLNYKGSSQLAMSIVFPEMLRYTLWRDLFETKALELLYVNGGKERADFSIGWMQMKPSFAEQIEERITRDSLLSLKYSSLVLYKTSNELDCRKERVKRLKTFHWQLIYLSAFVDICLPLYGLNNLDKSVQLLYLSAAYNKGLNNNKMKLEKFFSQKSFPYGPGRINPFAYTELATHFYLNESQKIFNN